jgi:signal transduction histidine kinase/ligand-binding sensor domain-containing protein
VSVSYQGQIRTGILAVCFWFVLGSCPASSWYARSWQVDEGMPGDSVTGVAQTRNGLLWIGTQAGLAHFDGVRFERMPMPTGRTYRIIRDFLLDRDEQLWLAEESGVLVRYNTSSGGIKEFTDGIPRAQPTAIVQSGDKAVWVAYADGSLSRIRNDTVRRFTEADGFLGSGGASLTVDNAGRLWFLKSGRLGYAAGDKFMIRTSIADRSTTIVAGRSGGIFICAGEQLLHYNGAGELVEVAQLNPGDGSVRPTRMLEDASGALWIGTMSHGLFRVEGTNVTRIETSHGRIKTIALDREGSVWVGTDGGGLNRLRLRVVELRGKEEGLPFETVRSACEDAEGVPWVVTQNGNVARLEDGRWRVFTTADGWQGQNATCITADQEGVIHIGTFSRGVHRWRKGKFIHSLSRAEGLARLGIRGLFPDRQGNLWIAFSGGDVLQRYRDGEFKNYALPAGSRAVRTMTEDAKGVIWMANLDAQLLRIQGDAVVDETALTPEPSRTIRCLTGTADGSLWIGYSVAGLGRLKEGKFTRLNREQGLQDDSICSLMPDERGWMWFGSDHGIFRARVDDLNEAMEGKQEGVKCFTHGRNDGLPSLQAYYGYFPGAVRKRDGGILIPTHSGLAIIRPELLEQAEFKSGSGGTNPLPPVLIEAVVLDNRELTNALRGTKLTIPPGHRRLEFRYTAPSFVDPDNIQFRVKLGGWDEDWVNVGRERSVRYPQLAAGEYEFRVIAENSNGSQTENRAAVKFVVVPYFWEHWWFSGGLLVLFTGTIFAIARYVAVRRLRQKVRVLEQENALQKERARIAQDIHDDIGARMTQIMLLVDMTQQAAANPARVGEHVSQIASMTRQGMKALDEIVWAVNPHNDTLQDLLDYGAQYAADFLSAAGIRCRVDFPMTPLNQNLPADVRHALLMVLKEALHNVVKHAQATEVWLRVELEQNVLRWHIDDNGQGFESAPDNALADGLRNMRERLAEFGGTCQVETSPGAGVKITFVLPIVEKSGEAT